MTNTFVYTVNDKNTYSRFLQLKWMLVWSFRLWWIIISCSRQMAAPTLMALKHWVLSGSHVTCRGAVHTGGTWDNGVVFSDFVGQTRQRSAVITAKLKKIQKVTPLQPVSTSASPVLLSSGLGLYCLRHWRHSHAGWRYSDVGTETEWIAARQRRQQCGDQCLGKMTLPLLPEPLMSPLQVEQNRADRTTLCISLVCLNPNPNPASKATEIKSV